MIAVLQHVGSLGLIRDHFIKGDLAARAVNLPRATWAIVALAPGLGWLNSELNALSTSPCCHLKRILLSPEVVDHGFFCPRILSLTHK